MTKANKRLIIASILILLFILISTTSFAKPVTDIFVSGLIQINDFFAGEQYRAYSEAIDFFFFSLLFISIYMMGVRYAFKEVRRPERVIAILLGLMTAFLLVLGGFSATMLLPFIHWVLYALLFMLYWWLLKGMKSKFWRFLLALLLTILTIALMQGLYNYLSAPEISGIRAPEVGLPEVGGIGGFFRDLFGNLGGIQIPGVSMGVPDWLRDLYGAPSVVTPSWPETLPLTGTPSTEATVTEKPGRSWLWVVVLLILVLAGLGAWRFWPRREPPEDLKDKIVREIDEVIRGKNEIKNRIYQKQLEKNHIIKSYDNAQSIVTELIEMDLANIWSNKARKKIKEEYRWILEFIDKEKELVMELKNLKDIEIELYKSKIDYWKKFLESKNIPNVEQDLLQLKEIIGLKTTPIDLKRIGIVWLIAICYNYEKLEFVSSQKIEALLKPDKESVMMQLLKTKFEGIKGNREKLLKNFAAEIGVLARLNWKIDLQVKKLQELKDKIRGAYPTHPPLVPPPTKHPKWPSDKGKYSPNPPEKPAFPLPRVIPKPPKPKPTKYKEFKIDLSPWFMPIKNQENSNACAAFASSAIVEFYRNSVRDLQEEKVQMGENLSELFLWYNFREDKQNNIGPYAFEMTKVFESIRKEGICFEGVWTWEPVDNGIPKKFATQPSNEAYADALTPYPQALSKQIVGWEELDPENPDQWIDNLKNHNPVYIGIQCDDEFKRAGDLQKNIYHNFTGTGDGHAVVIVGFTTDFPFDPTNPKNTIPAFKIRNSWGSNWGEKGYIWVPYDLLPQLLVIKPYILKWKKKEEGPKKEPKAGLPPAYIHLKIEQPSLNSEHYIGNEISELSIRTEGNLDELLKICDVLYYYWSLTGFGIDNNPIIDHPIAIEIIKPHKKTKKYRIPEIFIEQQYATLKVRLIGRINKKSNVLGEQEINIKLVKPPEGGIPLQETKGIFITVNQPQNDPEGLKPFSLYDHIKFRAVIANLEIPSKGYPYAWFKLNRENLDEMKPFKEGVALTNTVVDTVPASFLGIGEHLIVFALGTVFPDRPAPPKSLFSRFITIHIVFQIERKALKAGPERRMLIAGTSPYTATPEAIEAREEEITIRKELTDFDELLIREEAKAERDRKIGRISDYKKRFLKIVNVIEKEKSSVRKRISKSQIAKANKREISDLWQKLNENISNARKTYRFGYINAAKDNIHGLISLTSDSRIPVGRREGKTKIPYSRAEEKDMLRKGKRENI